MRKILYVVAAVIGVSTPANSQTSINWNDEANDTTRIVSMLDRGIKMSPATRISELGKMMLDTPYGAGTLEIAPERVTVNLDTVDCTTFVDDILALARTLNEGRLGWRDFIYNLENMRYRHGKVDGYASRLHYTSDWAVDNISRGNIKEITADLPGATYKVKTLDFISSHRNLYPALNDNKELERVKSIELGYRSHRMPVVPSSKINKAMLELLHDGDIIAFMSKTEGLDVAHIGIVSIIDGIPRLLHASSKAGRVIIDPLILPDYMRRNRQFTGVRLFRLTE